MKSADQTGTCDRLLMVAVSVAFVSWLPSHCPTNTSIIVQGTAFLIRFVNISSEKIKRPNTLIATISAEFPGLSHAEIVDKLISCLDVEEICCVQFVPRCYMRITFTSFDARLVFL